MKKQWKFKEKADWDRVLQISEMLNIDMISAELLIQRKIYTYDEAKAFFRPNLADLHDPFLMKDMNIAVERLDKAIENNENILIFGDYDVDGTTAVSMLYSFLKNRGVNVFYYIPDRYDEGYGVSEKGIDFAFENNCTLMISLDCGIKAVEQIEYANSQNIDFIVCDHHNPGEVLPTAIAILNPKRKDCDYPYKELSGCGVGFKFLQGYSNYKGLPVVEGGAIAEELSTYLDLVAVSIASDIVPMNGENRVLAYYGLKQLNSSPRVGLKSIIEVAGIDGKEIEVNDIVFKIGPRINAAGRIESGQRAVELLIAEDKEKADVVCEEVNRYNEERKSIDQSITEEAMSMIESDEKAADKKSTVLYNPEWHKGVVGIVASRIIERFYKPTIILTKCNGFVTGSARSVEGFDLYKAIDACSDVLEGFGGHMYAAGISLKEENLPMFIEKFENYVRENIKPENMVQQIEIDKMLSINDITPRLYRILKQFSPFGPQNMKPVFASKDVIDNGTGRVVGKEREHLKLDIKENISSNKVYPAIAFKQAVHYDAIKYRRPFDICYSVEENEYNGNTKIQIKIRDIRSNGDLN